MSSVPDLLPPGRLLGLDAARTLAVVCMVIFHFTFDLALFGFIPADPMSQPFWYYFARMIAGSFLFARFMSSDGFDRSYADAVLDDFVRVNAPH